MRATFTDLQQCVRPLVLAAILAPFALPALELANFDLKRDWSTNNNPNGVWRYRMDTLVLPAYFWNDSFTNPQPSWQRPFKSTLPAWILSTTDPVPVNRDWKAGDIIVHTQDDNLGFGQGQANAVWTSPFNGTVNISGGVWLGRKTDRANNWRLFVRGGLITQGFINSTDSYNRANPCLFEFGSEGTNVLRNLPVSIGDEIMLEIKRTSVFGEYVGVNFTVTQTVPDPNLNAEVGCVRLCYATASNAWYQVQYALAVDANDWTPLSAEVTAGDGQVHCMEVPVVPGAPRRFYRVVVRNAPP